MLQRTLWEGQRSGQVGGAEEWSSGEGQRARIDSGNLNLHNHFLSSVHTCKSHNMQYNFL